MSAKGPPRAARRSAWLAAAVLACATWPAVGAEAFFPFGVYEKSDLKPGSAAWRNGRSKLVEKVAGQGFNTLVTEAYREPAQTLFLLDRAQLAGLRVVQTIGNPLNRNWDFAGPGGRFDSVYRHAAVLAYKYGDEPANDADIKRLVESYRAIGAYYARPVVTAMVGEEVDLGVASIPVAAWRRLDARILMARYYPYRRTFGLGDTGGGKARLPFVDWCARMEALANGRPWWLVAQGLGTGTTLSQASYWRLPTATEARAMVHVALAHGARAVLVFAAEPEAAEDKQLRLLDDRMQPTRARDGSIPFEAYGELAQLASRHADLLTRHRPARFAAASSNASIAAVARSDPEGARNYLYVVNLDARAGSATLRLSGAGSIQVARDAYGGWCSKLVTQGSDRNLRVDLAPGEGRFYRLEAGPQCNGH